MNRDNKWAKIRHILYIVNPKTYSLLSGYLNFSEQSERIKIAR